MVGQLRNLPAKPTADRIDALLGLLSLHGDRHLPISAYSKGMRQKVLLSAALLHNPDLLLLDEPFSGLLSVRERVLSSTHGDAGRPDRRAEPRAPRLVAVVLVPGPFSAIEWLSGARPPGAPGLDGSEYCRVWNGRGLRTLLLPHTAQDRRGAGHRSRATRRQLVAAFWQFLHDGGRAVQCPDVAPQPPASDHSRFLFGNWVRHHDLFPEKPCRPTAVGGRSRQRSMAPSERAPAGFQCRDDGLLGGGDPRRVLDAARSARELGFPGHTGSGRFPVCGRTPAIVVRFSP
jgi:hypothetical protein